MKFTTSYYLALNNKTVNLYLINKYIHKDELT